MQGALALGSATTSVSGRGFRGGAARRRGGPAGGSGTAYRSLSTTNYHASKGEGTAGTPRGVYRPETQDVFDNTAEGYPNGSFARGAPGTAGGGGDDSNPTANDQNSGGGGGGNGGLGGRGGNAWNSNAPVGGFGGGGIASSGGIVTLGGGGGAGTRNNSAGDQGSGNAGGGIVMVRAGSLTGTGTIEADGLSANTADTTPDNDGGGGGGAGCTAVLAPGGGYGGLTVNARGGRGSDAWPTVAPTAYPGERHGPGGGGGGGRVILGGAPGATNVLGGAARITSQTPEVYGASDGNPGAWTRGSSSPRSPVSTRPERAAPSRRASWTSGSSVSGPPDTIDACRAATYAFTVVNNGPDAAVNATASFPVPAGTTFQSFAPASDWSCTTPVAGGTGAVSCTRATFASGASSSFSMTLRVACTTGTGTVIAVTGTVGTSSTDTWAPNDTTTTANIVGPSIQLLTRASIRGVRVDRAGLVEFATGWQQRTSGFHLYQTTDPSGRRGLQPLTEEMIPAPRPDSQLPILYSASTPPIAASGS